MASNHNVLSYTSTKSVGIAVSPAVAQPAARSRYRTIRLLASVLAVTLGCVAAPPPTPPVARSFVYTPPEQARQPLRITLALVRPSYLDAARLAREPQWAKDAAGAFTSSMQTDMEKLLIAKGFTVTGPYASLNDMTYPEKKGANLTLTPIVDISADARITGGTEAVGAFFAGRKEGVITFGGRVVLKMLEPLSGEAMWLKGVDIEPVQEPFVVTYNIVTHKGQKRENILSDTSEQAVTVALNKIYPIVMQQAWTYFNPEEIMQIKKQADEVRARKVY
jgi:hypothetical protein